VNINNNNNNTSSSSITKSESCDSRKLHSFLRLFHGYWYPARWSENNILYKNVNTKDTKNNVNCWPHKTTHLSAVKSKGLYTGCQTQGQ